LALLAFLAFLAMGVFGALGDIHGDFASARRIMERHPEVPFWLSVGDVADDQGCYEPVPSPLYWIKGNNENVDLIASGALPANLHFLPNGRAQSIEGIRVAGLGGTLAPTWYDTPASELPYPGQRADGVSAPAAGAGRRSRSTRPAAGPGRRSLGAGGRARPISDDKRRHFVREEVEACKALRDIDVFLTHEAPRPYFVGAGARRNDAGKTPINEVLAAMHPRLHLFGHHHRLTEQERQGVRSVGLDLVSKSYLLIDRTTLEYELRSSTDEQ
jgi:uncharacterized protein